MYQIIDSAPEELRDIGYGKLDESGSFSET